MAQQHQHGPGCGHTAIRHDHHTDYLSQGHLEHQEGGHTKRHRIAVSAKNPDSCRPLKHDGNHVHDANCGHEAIPHGDHIDYLVEGRLEHVHDGHVDDHGLVEVVSR